MNERKPIAESCRCSRCGNPINRPPLFPANPSWETCSRCTVDEMERQDMEGLRLSVALDRKRGRRR